MSTPSKRPAGTQPGAPQKRAFLMEPRNPRKEAQFDQAARIAGMTIQIQDLERQLSIAKAEVARLTLLSIAHPRNNKIIDLTSSEEEFELEDLSESDNEALLEDIATLFD